MTGRSILVLHAHPDDEAFRTAGIFAKYASRGDRVVAVYATRGEAGEMHDPALDPAETLGRLGEIREGEVRRGLGLLGVDEVYFLGYRDSGMKGSQDNADPRAFVNAPIEEAVSRLVDIMARTQPQVVVTYDEDGEGGYGHPDHIMANRVAVAAFHRARREPGGPQKLYYTASSRQSFQRWIDMLRRINLNVPWVSDDFNIEQYGLPDNEITAHIDISKYAPLKKQVLAAHRSQIPDDFFYLAVPDDAMASAAGTEHYVRIFPPARPGEQEDDLFAGVDTSTAAA